MSLGQTDADLHGIVGVYLVVGDEHKDHLWWFYRATDKVTIHEAPASLSQACIELDGAVKEDITPTVHMKLTRNCILTMEMALTSGEKGFLICEDDGVFMDGFLGYALDAITDTRRSHRCSPGTRPLL